MKEKELEKEAEERESGGKLVRDTWIAWAKEQPNPKPSWLVPWEELPEADKEVDRRIWQVCALSALKQVTKEEGKDLEQLSEHIGNTVWWNFNSTGLLRDDFVKSVAPNILRVLKQSALANAQNCHPSGLTPAVPNIDTLPADMTREDAVDALRAARDELYKLKKASDIGFVRYPDYDTLIKHIAEHGLPPL